MSLTQVSLILSQGHQGTSQRGQYLLLAMKHWMGSMGLGPAWQSKDVISFCIPKAIPLITHRTMYFTSIQAPLSLLPQSHPDCQTTQHPSHVCLTMLMLTMYGQENLFNSASLIISRATSSSQVKVLLPQEEAGTITKNVVYREALLTQ